MTVTSGELRVVGGRYQLHRCLHAEGDSELYVARDSQLDRPVLVRVFRVSLPDEHELRARVGRRARDIARAVHPEVAPHVPFDEQFRAEAAKAAELRHPNIAPVIDWGVLSDGDDEVTGCFVASEYVAGRTLSELTSRGEALAPEPAAEIAVDLAAALEAAHEAGIVHGGLNPGVVYETPEGLHKVTGFGPWPVTSRTPERAAYIAPEQVRAFIRRGSSAARGEADEQSDLFALGAVLYRLLTGKPPFVTEDGHPDRPRRGMHDRLTWPSDLLEEASERAEEKGDNAGEVRPALPGAIEAVTMKLLARDPGRRYETAGEVRAELLRFLAGDEVVAETEMLETLGTTEWEGEEDRHAEVYGPSRSGLVLTFGVLAFVALAIPVLAFAHTLNPFAWLFGPGASSEVPEVLGLTQAQAVVELQEVDLDAEANFAFSNDVTRGQVIGQQPAAGEVIAHDTTVVITVSRGPSIVTMPDVIGLPEAEAMTRLEDSGLVTQVLRVPDADVAAGRVIEIDPPAGSQVRGDTLVSLTISTGPPDRPVPDVVGGAFEQALLEIGQAQFQLGQVLPVPNALSPEGMVIAVSPEVGSLAAPDTSIDFLVSAGPPSTRMPWVSGLTEKEALKELAAAGLEVEIVQADGYQADRGRVNQQEPSAGSDIEPGDAVTITVGAP
ncbi:MAG: Serine/threonine-protein kinase PknB [Acidimicrobiales bacterium]|nr:MAG: serine/threonine protein kinase [Actinomycetota bacterium]MBV6508080.1 Serine/threonine-protein kinase PknB [Acidimicrobiales bacterium]RIK05295.1 MAG: hypothetical protein DCC48_10465 [Acidobacteriota bacterium]